MDAGDLNEVLINTHYRKVISTTETLQLVFMSIPIGEEIGGEIHPNTTQFFCIVSGKGEAVVKSPRTGTISTCDLFEGGWLIVPPGHYHNIINTSFTENLKLYTIYSPPEDPPDLVED